MIHVVNVSKEFMDGSKIIALKDITFDIAAEEFVAVTGPSGSGKTTLLNLLGTLDQPTCGTIRIDDMPLENLKGNQLADFRRNTIGFVFQTYHLLPHLTALENVYYPLLPYMHAGKRALVQRAEKLLTSVGLQNRFHHFPSQMSGGEQQRTAIARALINNPKVLLADEPTGNLDTDTGKAIISLLQEVNNQQHVTLVLVTHNAEVAAAADRVIHLIDGRRME